MGMPVALDRYYTRQEVLAFPDDGNRYELVYGELLVSPSPVPRHQVVLGKLHTRLSVYLEAHPVGRVLFSPADISWGRDDLLLQPDLFVVANEDARAKAWITMRRFHLFAEVLSPSTTRYDRFTKRRLYQEMAVPLYWMIDPRAERVEIWTPADTVPALDESRLAWRAPGAAAPCVIELRDLFAA
jgi:Uma2 family endonuclease